MAHVFFERGDHAGGAAWLDEWLPTTDPAGGFTAHLYWHHALHCLALGDTERVLGTYVDRLCGPSQTALPDRSSMLWRLQLHGIVDESDDPNSADFADMLSSSVDVIPFTFVGIHVALGLAAHGDVAALRRFAETADRSATPGASTLVQPIALALADRIDGAVASAADRLLAIEHQFPLLGGSHAQREVFEDTLIDTLIRAGRTEEASHRLQVRLDRRPSALDEGWLVTSVGAPRFPVSPGHQRLGRSSPKSATIKAPTAITRANMGTDELGTTAVSGAGRSVPGSLSGQPRAPSWAGVHPLTCLTCSSVLAP